jgi:PIN domain nuclease of toxin-antitoxin system
VILLDTHAWVWWVSDPARIPEVSRRVIRESLDGGDPVHVSTISTWEVALLVARGRLELTTGLEEWIALVESAPEIAFVPVDNRIAIRAVRLEGFPHRDPADRLIVATALERNARLVTADARLRGYGVLGTIWD